MFGMSKKLDRYDGDLVLASALSMTWERVKGCRTGSDKELSYRIGAFVLKPLDTRKASSSPVLSLEIVSCFNLLCLMMSVV